MKVKELFYILFISVICAIFTGCTSTDKEELVESTELYRIQGKRLHDDVLRRPN